MRRMNTDTFLFALKQTCALGLVPILAGDKEFDRFNKSIITTSGKLLINVSGIQFVLNRAAVNRYPDTLLGSDEREYFYNEDAGEYFFDRDPEMFRYILNYYQCGKLHFPRHLCASAFESELLFFEILPDHMADCCYEEYLDQLRDAKERSENRDFPVHLDSKKKSTFRETLRLVFDDPAYNDVAQVVYYTTGFFIIISVLSNMIETLVCTTPGDEDHPRTYGDKYHNVFFCIDTACVIIFTVEYIARLYAAKSRLAYVRSIMAVIDLIAILPYYISLLFTSDKHFSSSLVTLRVFRVFRIFKFSRHSQGLRILGFTLKSCARELGFLLFSLTLVVIIFATVIYYIEKFDPQTRFYSIPAASWYTIVTMTTLGYGDMVPSTVLGKLIGSVCSLCGVLVIALPVPVIVSNFSRIYQQNQRADARAARKRVQMVNLIRAHKERLKRLSARSHSHSSEEPSTSSRNDLRNDSNLAPECSFHR